MLLTMKALTAPNLLFALALLAASPMAAAQSIYKCTHAGQVEYTDHPCAKGSGEVIHQADDSEIIDQHLRLGQDAQAKSYAQTHHLEALYKQRVAAYQQAQDAKARDEAQAAADAQRRDEQAQQQALADEAANRRHLRAENEALREQNDAYRDQLAQPPPQPAYYGGIYAPPYRDHRHDHDHDHDHDHPPGPPPGKTVFHPCTQLAGGRVQC